jgi:energy-coupling factor transport system permease protein
MGNPMRTKKRGFLPDVSSLQNILGARSDSPLHRMDPRTKLFWFIMTFVGGLVVLEHLAALGGLLVYVFVLGAVARVSREQLVMIKVVLPLAFIVFLANLLLIPSTSSSAFEPIVDFGVKYPWYYLFRSLTETRNISITWESLYIGVARGMVVVTLSAVASLFILLTELTELVEGMHLLRLPYNFAFTVGLAVNYIPILFYDLTRISEAQRARGQRIDSGGMMHRLRASFSLILPVINCAYARTERIADAMASRGFGAAKKRTLVSEYRFTRFDYGFLFLSAGLLALFILLRVYYPVFEVRMEV